jgi:hypothetical protein
MLNDPKRLLNQSQVKSNNNNPPNRQQNNNFVNKFFIYLLIFELI